MSNLWGSVQRSVVPEITTHIHGLLGADKWSICPSLTQYYDAQGVDLQTSLRANMKEDRPKPVVRRLMKARRIVEIVIGQLSERFSTWIQHRSATHPNLDFTSRGVLNPSTFLGRLFKLSSID